VFTIGVAVALDEVPLSQPVATTPVAIASNAIKMTSFLEIVFNADNFLPDHNLPLQRDFLK
jgi:hypothetical protein